MLQTMESLFNTDVGLKHGDPDSSLFLGMETSGMTLVLILSAQMSVSQDNKSAHIQIRLLGHSQLVFL